MYPLSIFCIILPDLGYCSLHVLCQLLPSSYQNKLSKHMVSSASGGLLSMNNNFI